MCGGVVVKAVARGSSCQAERAEVKFLPWWDQVSREEADGELPADLGLRALPGERDN